MSSKSAGRLGLPGGKGKRELWRLERKSHRRFTRSAEKMKTEEFFKAQRRGPCRSEKTGFDEIYGEGKSQRQVRASVDAGVQGRDRGSAVEISGADVHESDAIDRPKADQDRNARDL